MNYYELFGFPVSPRVNKTLLAQKYFELQKNHHPDFFTRETEVDKETALEKSAAINKAFVIFQHEEKTIEYFLQIKGVILPAEKYQLPPGFLMQMMELNETLAEKDGVTVAAELAEIEKALYEEIEPLLQQYPTELHPASMEKLKAYYYKKKYLTRILDRLGD
jgi:molecular chaperone HscB